MNSARQMRSYKLTQFGAPLHEIIESPPLPTGTQVLLRVRACGVCHSDIHVSEGYFDLGRGRKVDLSGAIPLPRILGHEIVSVVDELGPDASGIRVGDRRVIYAGRLWTVRPVPSRTGEPLRAAEERRNSSRRGLQQLHSG
jgi:D-arabinose 1-dehydrogenase-like Zn-dependent alcohol dehydrogenase